MRSHAQHIHLNLRESSMDLSTLIPSESLQHYHYMIEWRDKRETFLSNPVWRLVE